MRRLWVGLDPGLRGGVAAVDEAGRPVFAKPMPVLNDRIDTRAVHAELVAAACMHEVGATIELQGLRPRQAGGMKIGANYGRLLGALELAGVPFREITSPQWSRLADVPAGLDGARKKQASYGAAQRLWGSAFTDLGLRQTQDGPVEALLIAYWGMANRRA